MKVKVLSFIIVIFIMSGIFPVNVSAENDVFVAVSAGYNHNLAIKSGFSLGLGK